MSPSRTDQGAVYIAPNMKFDFTEVQVPGQGPRTGRGRLGGAVQGSYRERRRHPVVVWPIHDYGAASMGYEPPRRSPRKCIRISSRKPMPATTSSSRWKILHPELRHSRRRISAIRPQATLSRRRSPRTPTAPDVGDMALNVVDGGTEVIKSVTNWYAYNSQELFLPRKGGTFTVNLGATQDSVTHIASLPTRCGSALSYWQRPRPQLLHSGSG